MGIQFVPAGVAATVGARTLAARAVSTATRMFRGGGGKPPSAPAIPKGISQPPPKTLPVKATSSDVKPPKTVVSRGGKIAAGAKAITGNLASNAGMVGAFVAADALLSEDELIEDALLEDEPVRGALPERVAPTVELEHPEILPEREYRELSIMDDNEGKDALLMPDAGYRRLSERGEESSSEMIAYAAELVMQRMDSKPLLDQVEFLSRRYDLTRSEAFEVAAAANVYKFHPHVTEIVAAVSSFNTTGTLLLGAIRATRGV